MRGTGLIWIGVLLLMVFLPNGLNATEPSEEPPERSPSESSQSSDAPTRTPAARGDRIDLGTATLGHLEMAAGPIQLAVGAFNRVHVGTYVLPWFAGLIVPGSVIGSLFTKVRAFRHASWSGAVHTSLFYLFLKDVDGDDLDARAFIWPTKLILSQEWTERLATTFELTGVFTEITARGFAETDTEIRGVALARTIHAGLIPQLHVRPWLTVFLRGRVLLGRAPIVARADSQLSETTRIEIAARTDGDQLSSGIAGVGGVHLHWPAFSVSFASGYGTWFLPLVQLPIGENAWIGEVDLYFRF